MAGRTRKTVGSGRVERVVKQGPRASVVRGNKGQGGSAANRKGKAAKDEGLGDQKAIGIDILAPERREAVKAGKNRQKPAAEAAPASAVLLGLQDLQGDIAILEDMRIDEFGAAEDLWEAFRNRWDQEAVFWRSLRKIIAKVEAKNV